MNIIKQSSISFILVLALSLFISGCGGGPTAGLSLVGDDNNPGDNPSPPIVDLLSNPKPPAPVITTAEATPGSVFLKWIDTSSREYGFIIVRDGVKVGETDKNISQWTDTTVSPATTYTYLVVAWNKEGESVSPERMVATPSLPTPPKWILPEGAQIGSLAVDQATGELYASGVTYESLPGFTNAGGSDMFLAKLNLDGTIAHLQQWGTAENDFDADLNVLNGKVYVVWGTDPYLISVHGLRISTFDTSGTMLWDVAFSHPEDIDSIVPAGGALYVFQGSPVLTFGVRIRKLDSETGSTIWVRDEPRWVLSNVITANAEMYGIMSPPNSGSFAGKYDPDANDFLWTSPLWDIQGPSMESYFDITANSGGVYVVGWWGLNSIIPPDQGGGSDPMRCLLFQYDAQGNFRWAHQDDRVGYFWRVISDNDAAYMIGGSSGVCGLTKITNDGTLAWQTSVVGRSLALFNDVLFVADGSNVIYRYDAFTGSALP